MASETYLGNPNLKNVGQNVEWTEETLQEYVKCKDDPLHFVETVSYTHLTLPTIYSV